LPDIPDVGRKETRPTLACRELRRMMNLAIRRNTLTLCALS